jgi:mannonate dehydratase
MRWFGPSDAVSLTQIRQAGATGIVTALHHVPCGEEWTEGEIAQRKTEVEAAGLEWAVVESVPVHEDIKRRTGDCELYLERYRASLRHLGRAGIRTVCYNFMAVTDWTRTHLDMIMPTGAQALRFDMVDAIAFDLFVLRDRSAAAAYDPAAVEAAEQRWLTKGDGERKALAEVILMGLPGTVDDLTPGQFRMRLDTYGDIDDSTLRANLLWFLENVLPVAEEEGVSLAIHPDDPPFRIFGLPRVAGTEADLAAIFDALPTPANGLTFCTGSLGAHRDNDLPAMLDRFGDRVHFLHLRSVRREPDGSFFEDEHLAGSSDMAAVMRKAIEIADRRNVALPMRPDHGHLIADDAEKTGFYPGYSYLGRLRGLAELRGLEIGLRHQG